MELVKGFVMAKEKEGQKSYLWIPVCYFDGYPAITCGTKNAKCKRMIKKTNVKMDQM